MKIAVAFAALALRVDAHGGLTFPRPRNNVKNEDPETSERNHDRADCGGGECHWFNEGCWIGCPSCTSEMPKSGSNYRNKPNNCTNPKEPTLPERFRTYNIGNVSAAGDWTKYHPWRAPGYAPVVDSCGSTAYKAVGAKGFERGSQLPQLKGPKTEWIAGDVAEVGTMIGANHGGGYVFSLCPASQPLTEECFEKTTLAFVGQQHTIRYLDNGTQFNIPAMDVNTGTWPQGSTWRRVPFPACNCDYGRDCQMDNKGDEHSSYADEGKPEPYAYSCPFGTQFPVPFPYGYGDHIHDNTLGSPERAMWAIVDQIRVPEVSGEFVLRWRWDCEQTPQVWAHCADITIKSSPTPPASGTPAPTYLPATPRPPAPPTPPPAPPAPLPPPSAECPFTLRAGRVLGKGTVAPTEEAADAAGCCARCAGNELCTVFSYNSKSRKCFLKNTTVDKGADPAHISGLRNATRAPRP